MIYTYAFALAAAVLGGPNDAGSTGASAESAEKKVCKRTVETGSVMPKSVCRTKAEWAAITAKAQSDMERTQMQDRSRSMTGGSRN